VGLRRPDLSILGDKFLNEVQNLPDRNLGVEMLEKLLSGANRTAPKRCAEF